jgi:DNA-binding NarL/FixJ family response regulator
MLYAFRRRIVDQKNLYLYDKVELANEARALVEHGMTDRKKILVTLISMGYDARRIAEELRVSKQAVYKALASLPANYKPA